MLGSLAVLFGGATLFGQQTQTLASQPPSSTTLQAQSLVPPQATTPAPPKDPSPAAKHKLGPLEVSINWRTRAEGWNWFQGKTGNSDYGLWDSLLRVGIGQTGERIDWFIEGEQPSILGLPNNAVVAAPQGQLGLGANYYAANNNH